MMRAWVGRWLPWSKPWGYYSGHHHVVSLLLLLPHSVGEDELESTKSLFLTFLTLAVVLSLKPWFRIHFHRWEELPCNWCALLRGELSFLHNPRWLFSFYGFIWEGRKQLFCDSIWFLSLSVLKCAKFHWLHSGIWWQHSSQELLNRVDGLSAMVGDGSQRPFWCFGKPDGIYVRCEPLIELLLGERGVTILQQY